MRVDDLDKTVAFYEKVFGLQVTRRHESPRGSKLDFLPYRIAKKKLKSLTSPVPVTSRFKRI